MSIPTILAATDLSLPARQALERAYLVAMETNCALWAVHAISLSLFDQMRMVLGAETERFKEHALREAESKLDEQLAVCYRFGSLPVKKEVVDGHLLHVLAKRLQHPGVELLVIGARGHSFLRRNLLGTTAVRLLRIPLPVPILVVKEPPRESYRNVLVAVDLSPISLAVIAAARRWAPHADWTLVHVVELPFEELLRRNGVAQETIDRFVGETVAARRKQVHELAKAAGLADGQFRVRVVAGTTTLQLLALEQEYESDLVVVGQHGEGAIEHFLLGSVAKHLLMESRADVLVAVSAPQRT